MYGLSWGDRGRREIHVSPESVRSVSVTLRMEGWTDGPMNLYSYSLISLGCLFFFIAEFVFVRGGMRLASE